MGIDGCIYFIHVILFNTITTLYKQPNSLFLTFWCFCNNLYWNSTSIEFLIFCLCRDYVNIIRSVFNDIQSQREQQSVRSNPIEQRENEPENLTAPSKLHPAVVRNDPSPPVDLVGPVDLAVPAPKPVSTTGPETTSAADVSRAAPVGSSSASTSESTPHVSNSLPTPERANEKPNDNNQAPLKLTINRSRLSTNTETTPARGSAEKNVSSPIGSPTACCKQCGDPMSSSFRCSKCHSRKSVDIQCPNCNQVNQDLKGYSCRFCYTSLLEVLTTGEVKAAEQPTSEKPESEKKKKKLKRKKLESSPKVVANQTSSSSIKQPTKQNNESDACSKPSVVEENNIEIKRPRLKTVIHKNVEDSFSVKPPSEVIKTPIRSNKLKTIIPAKSHHRAVISKISVDDLTPQPPKPHQRAKEAQQKERPHTKLPIPPPPRQERNIFSNLGEPALSDSDSDSDSDHQIPPLVLRRKSDVESTSTAPEKKVVQSEPVYSAPPTKRPVNQGLLMSKKQRTILSRMKQVGRNKTFLKQPKNSSKSPASPEWEISKRRKPGPKSKTSYYTVNQNWGLPRYIKIPYNLDLPKVCYVHLSHFPQALMKKIRLHQPNLNLKTLYA